MGKIRQSLLPITTFVPIDVKRLFRDKVGIFFVFVFPLIFLLIFGTIFGGDSNVSFKVGLLNQSNSEFATKFIDQMKDTKVFNIDEDVTNIDEARQKMNRGQITSTIILPEDFGTVKADGLPGGQAQVLYDQNNEQAGKTLASILNDMFTKINSEFVKPVTPFTVKTESTATQGLRSFDYTFSGLLGFTILSLGIYGPTTVFPRLKQRGVLRRYHTTTLKVWQYFTANVASNALVGLMAVALMFVTAMLVFDLNMHGDFASLIILLILGISLMFGIGLAIGGWAKNENQAAPLAQLATLPMMFLSGVFFPTFLMPAWLQNITQFIPLTPIIDGVRLIVTEGKTLLELGPQLLVIGVWLIVIYFIAFRVFRWE